MDISKRASKQHVTQIHPVLWNRLVSGRPNVGSEPAYFLEDGFSHRPNISDALMFT